MGSQFTALFFGRIFGAVASVALIRYLGAEKQGVYSYILSTVALFGFVADLGLNNLLVRELKSSGPDAPKIFGNAIMVQAAQICAAVILVNLYALFFEINSAAKYNLMLASVIFSVNFAAQPYTGALNSFEKMHLTGLISSLASFFNSVFIFTAIYLKMSITGILIMLGVSNLANYFMSRSFGLANTVRPEFKPDWNVMKKLLKMSVPLALIGFFSFVYVRMDVMLLFKIRGAEEAGYYSAVSKIMEILIAATIAMASPFFPRISFLINTGSHASALKLMRFSIKYLAALSVPFVLAVSMLSSDYAVLLLGKAFVSSGFALSVLIWVIFTLSVMAVPSYALNASRYMKLLTSIYGFNMVTSLSLNLILMPKYGINAAAIINVLCNSIAMVSIVYYTHKKVGDTGIGSFILKIILALAAEAAVLHFAYNKMPFIILTFAGIAVYTAVLLAGGFVNKSDINSVFGIFKKQ
jgi:O-antigen/teichoic acid export membrane protein